MEDCGVPELLYGSDTSSDGEDWEEDDERQRQPEPAPAPAPAELWTEAKSSELAAFNPLAGQGSPEPALGLSQRLRGGDDAFRSAQAEANGLRPQPRHERRRREHTVAHAPTAQTVPCPTVFFEYQIEISSLVWMVHL